MPRKSKSDEYQDDAKVRAWLLDQREHVVSYLRDQMVQLATQPVPEWDLAPYIAVWSLPGGWAISGDLPTDHVLDETIIGPREALRFFSRRFAEVAACMLDGQRHPLIAIGDPINTEQQQQLGKLLASRAQTLGEFAEDDKLWPEQLAEWQDRLDEPGATVDQPHN
jgi:hypothetical protein